MTTAFREALETAFVRPEALATSSAIASPLPPGVTRGAPEESPIALPLAGLPRVSAGLEETLRRHLVQRGDWGALDAGRLRRVDARRERLGWPLTRTQLVLIRRSLLHARFGPTELFRAHECAEELCRRYDAGERALVLAREYDFPPAVVMRAILAARGLTREQAKRALASPAEVLGARDCAHIREAQVNDLLFGSAAEQEAGLAPGVDGEVRVRAALCRLLDACGVSFSVRSSVDEGGSGAARKGASTASGFAAARLADPAAPRLGVSVGEVPLEHLEPQLLLHSAAQLGGRPVCWVEVRPIYARATDMPFLAMQVAKHVSRFGNGLLICSGGVGTDVELPDCVVIGANAQLLSAAAEQAARDGIGNGRGNVDGAGDEAPARAALVACAKAHDNSLSPWLARQLSELQRRLVFHSWARRLTSTSARARWCSRASWSKRRRPNSS